MTTEQEHTEMADETPFACTLRPEDAARREADDRALAAQLTAHGWDDERRAVLAFPAAAAPLVQRFVRDESACCAFFEFTVDRDDEEVRLRVTAPQGAEPILRRLVAALTG